MKVQVRHAHSNEVETFRGSADEVRAQLHARYRWLQRYAGETLQQDIAHLNRQQNLFVSVEE